MILSQEQEQAVIDLIIDVGDNFVLPKFKNLHEGDVEFKESANDPVSVVDRGAEELLYKGLEKILPDSLFIGEETYFINPDIIEYLNNDRKPVWLIDPIDGTKNFVDGREGFGVMIGLGFNQEIVKCWLYEICTKQLTVYDKDTGIKINGKEFTSALKPNSTIIGNIGYKLKDKYPKLNDLVLPEGLENRPFASLPAIVGYDMILKGELDFLMYHRTLPWDHLSGITLIRSLGGACIRWDGEDHQFTDIDKGLIVAKNREIAEYIRTQIADKII